MDKEAYTRIVNELKHFSQEDIRILLSNFTEEDLAYALEHKAIFNREKNNKHKEIEELEEYGQWNIAHSVENQPTLNII